jgi:hypothetical protein
MNIFQLKYDARLRSWNELRTTLADSAIKIKCTKIDEWWQNAPLVNHHLHPHDISNWPDPWELLSENTYCEVARALGMCYTLYLIGVNDIELVLAKDIDSNEVPLVIVLDTYILNYWPNTVQTNKTTDFTLSTRISIDSLKEKIR